MNSIIEHMFDVKDFVDKQNEIDNLYVNISLNVDHLDWARYIHFMYHQRQFRLDKPNYDKIPDQQKRELLKKYLNKPEF